MPVSFCACPYCCGACEMIDERSIQGYTCIECQKEHIVTDPESGEEFAIDEWKGK